MRVPGPASGFMHSTRERILHHLKRQPDSSVDVLVRALGLAPMTIRQHLSNLSSEGLVDVAIEERPGERRAIGRPTHVFNLTPRSDERFPKSYDRLAHLLLEEFESDSLDLPGLAAGPAGSAETAEDERRGAYRRIAQRAAAPHRDRLQGLAAEARLEAAVAILRDESGFTEIQTTSAGYEVREYNCVFQRVAEGHGEICTFHTEYVSALVGARAQLEACQCDGANACRFSFTME